MVLWNLFGSINLTDMSLRAHTVQVARGNDGHERFVRRDWSAEQIILLLTSAHERIPLLFASEWIARRTSSESSRTLNFFSRRPISKNNLLIYRLFSDRASLHEHCKSTIFRRVTNPSSATPREG